MDNTENEGGFSFPIENLTDEQILREFVKKFKCDGAMLLYLDGNVVYSFGRWRNPIGRRWFRDLWKKISEGEVINK